MIGINDIKAILNDTMINKKYIKNICLVDINNVSYEISDWTIWGNIISFNIENSKVYLFQNYIKSIRIEYNSEYIKNEEMVMTEMRDYFSGNLKKV